MTRQVKMKRDTELNRPQDALWIEVNRVASFWDGNGNVKGLRAQRLTCFREEHLGHCDSLTLREHCVAYSLRNFRLLSTTFRDGETIVLFQFVAGI